MKMLCSDCAAFSALTKECRRHAPTATIVPGPEGKPLVIGLWPGTKPDNWCMEYVSEKKE